MGTNAGSFPRVAALGLILLLLVGAPRSFREGSVPPRALHLVEREQPLRPGATWSRSVSRPFRAEDHPALRIDLASAGKTVNRVTVRASWLRLDAAAPTAYAAGTGTWSVHLLPGQRERLLLDLARQADGPCFDCYRGFIASLDVAVTASREDVVVHDAWLDRSTVLQRAAARVRNDRVSPPIVLLAVSLLIAAGMRMSGVRWPLARVLLGVWVVVGVVELGDDARALWKRSWALAPGAGVAVAHDRQGPPGIVRDLASLRPCIPSGSSVLVATRVRDPYRMFQAGFALPMRDYDLPGATDGGCFGAGVPPTRPPDLLLVIDPGCYAVAECPIATPARWAPVKANDALVGTVVVPIAATAIGVRLETRSTARYTVRVGFQGARRAYTSCVRSQGSGECMFDRPLQARPGDTLVLEVAPDADAAFRVGGPPGLAQLGATLVLEIPGYRLARSAANVELFERDGLPACTR